MATKQENKKNKALSPPQPLPDYGMKGRDYSLPFTLVNETVKNTSIANYYETEITLPMGRINRVWINMPRGCSGLVGMQLWRASRQIFPIPEGIWFIADNFFNSFAFTHIIHTVPNEIQMRTYNLDDTYQHTVTTTLEMSGNQTDIPANMLGFFETLGLR